MCCHEVKVHNCICSAPVALNGVLTFLRVSSPISRHLQLESSTVTGTSQMLLLQLLRRRRRQHQHQHQHQRLHQRLHLQLHLHHLQLHLHHLQLHLHHHFQLQLHHQLHLQLHLHYHLQLHLLKNRPLRPLQLHRLTFTSRHRSLWLRPPLFLVPLPNLLLMLNPLPTLSLPLRQPRRLAHQSLIRQSLIIHQLWSHRRRTLYLRIRRQTMVRLLNL